jgi:hypothetical protein
MLLRSFPPSRFRVFATDWNDFDGRPVAAESVAGSEGNFQCRIVVQLPAAEADGAASSPSLTTAEPPEPSAQRDPSRG